ncbi:Drug/metabolite permease, DMT superfamily [Planktothrix tepida]|uniref:Drug/metabolite permease, DMT superfamily n=3 Tax=Planktothrix TaxID=54304 RepID=A0A1J1LDM1_9CYAN|nr:DMT family transporter [Planktothrix tepida]CAD5917019.1 Drug/metabolite permease, DMT superfamily [Planktothrix tepida]CAD5985345.1 Drug/metabolite permease, DMT superfamily [Planktothrix pseudagardhii]CUR30703.1 Drug/metabolite permease, DMT superfamily [Planktothrix tepida PCC 9214]
MTQTQPNSSQSEVKESSASALILLGVGLVALASTAIFIKLSVREISAEATVFNRLWIATIAFAGWNALGWGRSPESNNTSELINSGITSEAESSTTEPSWGDRLRSFPKLTILLLVSLALVHLGGRFLWTWSLTQTTAANGAMLANMPPIFTALGGWLFFGQRFDRRFLTGLTIAIVGAVVLVLGDWLHPTEELFGPTAIIGDGAALLSSVFYAGSFLLVEKLRQRLSTSDILVWRCALGLVIAAPLVWIIDDVIFPMSTIGWIAVFGLALISEVTGHGLIVYSLKHFSSAFVTIVLLLEPAPTAAVAWIFFGEFLQPLNFLGFLLISIGIYLAKTGEGSASANQNDSASSIPSEELVEAAIEP